MNKILVINPGSTSTKIGLYDGEDKIFEKTIRHSVDDLKAFDKVADQTEYRKEVLLTFFKENNVNIKELAVVIGRGGMLKPIPSGTYKVNKEMIDTIVEARYGEHASNLGALLAKPIADSVGIDAYIADPVVVDELDEIARIAGHPQFYRRSVFHALNHKAVAKDIANELGKKYEDCNFVLAHLGGGISIGAHKKGKIIDVNNALAGEGAFSPERSGTVPSGQLVELCFSKKYTKDEICKMLVGKGGVSAHLKTNNMLEVENRIKEGDIESDKILNAMAYQVAKEIGAYSTVLKGDIDCIIITGGVAYDKHFVDLISERVNFIAPVKVYPGEDELRALAKSVFRVISGKEEAKIYQ